MFIGYSIFFLQKFLFSTSLTDFFVFISKYNHTSSGCSVRTGVMGMQEKGFTGMFSEKLLYRFGFRIMLTFHIDK